MQKNNYNKYYDWIPMPVRVIGVLLVSYSGYKWIKKEIASAEANKRRRQLEGSQVDYVYQDQQGNVQTVSIDLGTVAATLYDSLTPDWWDPFNEDEKRAIRTILQVPRSEIPMLEDLYFKLYNKVLKEDFIDGLNEQDWSKVKHLFS